MANDWPANKVERMDIARLIPYAKNSRTHSDDQVAQIAASMKEWGWTNPILVDESGQIIAGHGRVLAARKLGYTQAPVMVAKGWTEPQKRAYVIADNKLALNAGWDMDLLKLEMQDLRGEVDLTLMGFSDEELATLLQGENEAGESVESGAGSLAARFMVAPFSVLNAREGWWQERKRAWLALGIKSELGRGSPASTSARVGPNDEATYRTIGGKKVTASPGGGHAQHATTARSSAAMARAGQ